MTLRKQVYVKDPLTTLDSSSYSVPLARQGRRAPFSVSLPWDRASSGLTLGRGSRCELDNARSCSSKGTVDLYALSVPKREAKAHPGVGLLVSGPSLSSLQYNEVPHHSMISRLNRSPAFYERHSHEGEYKIGQRGEGPSSWYTGSMSAQTLDVASKGRANDVLADAMV